MNSKILARMPLPQLMRVTEKVQQQRALIDDIIKMRLLFHCMRYLNTSINVQSFGNLDKFRVP